VVGPKTARAASDQRRSQSQSSLDWGFSLPAHPWAWRDGTLVRTLALRCRAAGCAQAVRPPPTGA
jgi:hypothetical protein